MNAQSTRRRIVTNYGEQIIVQIAYIGTLAQDLPNGLKESRRDHPNAGQIHLHLQRG